MSRFSALLNLEEILNIKTITTKIYVQLNLSKKLNN